MSDAPNFGAIRLFHTAYGWIFSRKLFQVRSNTKHNAAKAWPRVLFTITSQGVFPSSISNSILHPLLCLSITFSVWELDGWNFACKLMKDSTFHRYLPRFSTSASSPDIGGVVFFDQAVVLRKERGTIRLSLSLSQHLPQTGNERGL